MQSNQVPHAAVTPETLADPPVAATSAAHGRPSAGGAFGEFMADDLPRWALVRHRMDPAEVEDVAEAVGPALESVKS